MNNQVRIEDKGNEYAILLVHHGSEQEMDVRVTYADAEQFAIYLARRLKLPVFYKGREINMNERGRYS